MLDKIVKFSITNKLIVILFTITIAGFGLYSVYKIPVGTVPDITNNQVQVITTSTNLSTQEIEQFITAPVEMEMANLPGVIEIRSISKFGISMVTIVFEEKLGTYLPRQLIAEKIKSAAEKIPEAYGTPEMGPISTGLGEIYQYILDVKPGYEEMYSPMELRTIQDWIVKRRLAGIKGVVEVNSWGGYLKQYEIAIDPNLLKSLNVNLLQVYDALEKNNNISGGSYIEKNNQSYFIRGDGQLKSIDDIKNILITSREGNPILVKDIGTVHFGYANRFGAITANGKGETILGQIMMLKNANSKEVINAVKAQVDEIQQNLPEGVFINPILERGELITKTSHTVAENLVLGAVIVLLTVLLLLGNIRSALVIASVIPLALLFTISMMYIFGIDANLMSLGALDFGIIIDGAVIIVEFIVLRMSTMKNEIQGLNSDKKREFINELAYTSSSKMMKSAVFGQVIILIVFIPILSLSGVEGKMFHPMALSFSFAIIGAMIMGLTWLPVASSLFLKPGDLNKRTFAVKLIDFIYKLYFPVLKWSCAHKKIVLGASIVVLAGTVFIFSNMGGEFVPTLDEGDYVIQPALKTGTSLSETIEITTKMENILIDHFPDEVDQIVCRIGAAEVPTDPMSMEEIDMIIKLHPKDQWEKAKTKEQLAEAFKNSLSIIPGIEYEFTQPIEMRFNELITGVRADIAIKIFGDDLNYIDDKANEIKNLIADIPGASDVIIEKTTGLPQIKIEYNRKQLSKYQLNTETLNTYLSTAFGGKIAGVIFEGERRFDMVLRFQHTNRTDINDIKNLMVAIPSGELIPLSEFAEISYTQGPAKISRDNTQRRVVVSVNVRDRDLQSVVEDIRLVVDEHIKLKPGNYIEYGGQFENLQNASKRLLLAVPVALVLIFIFLHFAFQSFKDAIMIFTAIPLATVGGVLLLWIRNMPFSVSAGIGFIALFGIAVLNGIVLIEHLKELRDQKNINIQEIIFIGTRNRLRPVLLTAGAAAMGFLPMAISTGSGAEVQRPLATVVIGGLFTSTMLTMIVLPLLFEIFYNVVNIKLFPLRIIRYKAPILILLLLIPTQNLFSQEKELDLNKITSITLEKNPQLNAYHFQTQISEKNIATSWSIPKTFVSYGTDQNNIAENGYPLYVWSVEQEIAFPTFYSATKKQNQINASISAAEYNIRKNQILKETSIYYFENLMLQKQIDIYKGLDSIYNRLLKQAEIKYKSKAVNKLELLNIQSKQNEISIVLDDLITKKRIAFRSLQTIMNYPEEFSLPDTLEKFKKNEITNNTTVNEYYALLTQHAASQISIEKNKTLPDFTFNYFIGSNSYANAKKYQGFEFGFALPIFLGHQKANITVAKLSYEAQKLMSENNMAEVNQKIFSLQEEINKQDKILNRFLEIDLLLAEEIKRTAMKAYTLREIDFFRFANSYESAVNIEFRYYESIFNYNRSVLELFYFSNLTK